MKKPNKSGRTRLFATVVYPESAPSDWLTKLSDLCIPAFVSPLHNQDVDEGSGEIKKEHYHVMFMFDGVKTPDQFDEIRQLIGGVGTEFIQSKRGYARYLCHLDQHDKHKYNTDDVIQFGGADYSLEVASNADKRKVTKEIITYIRNNNITAFCELMDYAMEYEPEWFDALTTHCAYIANMYITDVRRVFFKSR